MRNDRAVKFIQSQNDFPLTVSLGGKLPSWGLTRWRGDNGLRFVPSDDEGFSLRGDKRQLLYKGRRRSHRFTIHSDTSFEYDCILNREPESNVISLRMENAEGFDFLRQPDFVPDPFLKGSYAVYKKETLIGEGTGKLCHIHRPQIIDARGRRCWGELSIVGNELRITIPEQWLAEAAYPVVVDPTVGTTAIGSQNRFDGSPLMFEIQIPVNRFFVSEAINGICTAFIYTNQTDPEAFGRPVIYSDNGNSPLTKRSSEESLIDLRVSGGNVGWRTGTFRTSGVSAGSNIWFGVFCEYFWFPRFDFGARCYTDWWDGWPLVIPNSYPVWNVNHFFDFRLSMYFTYTSAQNFVRTLTQGVNLSDTRRLTASYIRSSTQTARLSSAVSRFPAFFRRCEQTVRNTMSLSRFPVFIRSVTENINVGSAKNEKLSYSRNCKDDVRAISVNKRIHSIMRSIQDNLKSLDSQTISLLYFRSVTDETLAIDKSSHFGSFIRGLFTTAESTAETKHGANYHRFNADTVQADGSVFRGLLLFVKIISQVFIRDYLLGRFLKSRQKIVLKSCVCRELKLESRIG